MESGKVETTELIDGIRTHTTNLSIETTKGQIALFEELIDTAN
jgi:hypothetical protein